MGPTQTYPQVHKGWKSFALSRETRSEVVWKGTPLWSHRHHSSALCLPCPRSVWNTGVPLGIWVQRKNAKLQELSKQTEDQSTDRALDSWLVNIMVVHQTKDTPVHQLGTAQTPQWASASSTQAIFTPFCPVCMEGHSNFMHKSVWHFYSLLNIFSWICYLHLVQINSLLWSQI